jgi:hypothetical protein
MPLDTERDGLEGVRDLHGTGVRMQRWNTGMIEGGFSQPKRLYPAQVRKAAAPPFNHKPGHAIRPPIRRTVGDGYERCAQRDDWIDTPRREGESHGGRDVVSGIERPTCDGAGGVGELLRFDHTHGVSVELERRQASDTPSVSVSLDAQGPAKAITSLGGMVVQRLDEVCGVDLATCPSAGGRARSASGPLGLLAAISERRFDRALSHLETALHRAARLRRMDRKLVRDIQRLAALAERR